MNILAAEAISSLPLSGYNVLLMVFRLRLVIMDEFIRKPSIDDLKCKHATEQTDTTTEDEMQGRGPSPCVVHHRRHVEEDLE